jgi:hypothetical protein
MVSMWDVISSFCVAYWPGMVVAGVLLFVAGYVLAKITATSPVWKAFGEFVVRQINAVNVVTKDDIRDTVVGTSAAVNGMLDKLEPKEGFKRAPIKARVAEALAEQVPGGKVALGVFKAARWLVRRRKAKK